MASTTPEAAVAGDSRPAGGFSIPANVAQGYKSAGFTTWLRQLTRQRINIPLANNFAVGGSTTADLVNLQLPQVLASSAKLVFLLSSTNDRTSVSPAFTYEQTISNLNAFITAVTGAGKSIIVIAELPRGSAGAPGTRLTGTALKDHMRVHRWLQRQAYRQLVTVVDAFSAWTNDPLDTFLVDVNTTLAPDSLHPGSRGAYDLAARIQPIIEARYPPVDILPITNADVYHATENPFGVWGVNPMLAGTGGTVQAPSAGTLTGQAANSTRVRLGNGVTDDSAAGLSVAASVVTVNGLRGQRLVVTGTPTSANPWVQVDTFGFTLTAGWVVEAVAAYQVDAGQVGLNSIELQLSQPSGAKIFIDGQALTATDPFPVSAISGVLKTDAFTVDQTGGSTLKVRINLIQNLAANAVITIFSPAGRRIA